MPSRLAIILTAGVFGLAFLAGCGSESEPEPPAGAPAGSGQAERPSPDPALAEAGIPAFNPALIYEQAIDGVVSIRSVFGDLRDPISAAAAGGSGFVLSEDGEIVTNAHVISDGAGENRQPAENVYVEFSTGDVLDAEIVGLDPFADVALLKVADDAVELKPLTLADSDRVRVGQPVAVIGSPFGEHQTLTTGIVSQTGRSVMSLTDFQIEGAIQTDASINPGNSGGPMLDGNAHVIGISQQMKSHSGSSDGVGFGVPANSVEHSVEMLRARGEPHYAYIGVSTQPLYPQLAERLDIDVPSGAMVAEVMEGGPAAEAGIEGGQRNLIFQGARYDVGGDVIVAVNGVPVEAVEDLGRIISRLTPGDTAQIEVVRDGERRTVEVELENRPVALSQR